MLEGEVTKKGKRKDKMSLWYWTGSRRPLSALCHVRTQEVIRVGTRGGTSPKHKHASTLASDFQPPELWETSSCRLLPPVGVIL